MRPIKLDLQQGGEAWLLYRRSHLMASDTAKIVGLNPYESAYDCYMEKIEGKTKFVSSAMKRGTALEPLSRSWLETKYGKKFDATVLEHPEISYMGASLDCYSEDGKELHEIKNPMSKGFYKVKEANHPNLHDIYQCQKQMLVANVNQMHIHYFDINEDHVIVEVLSFLIPIDQGMIQEIKEHEALFWKMMVDHTPPPNTKSGIEETENVEFLLIEKLLKGASEDRDEIDEVIERYKKRLIELSNGGKVKGEFVRVVPRKGSKTTNWRSVCSELKPSADLVAKYTKIGKDGYVVSFVKKKC